MSISKFESTLLTRVDMLLFRILRKLFGWFYIPIVDGYLWSIKSIKAMYYDFDTWVDEGGDMEDSQLFKLGLDVERINDREEYWGYNVGTDRNNRGNRGRDTNRPPEWV